MMNKSKVTEHDYIDFLIGTQGVYSNAEAERVCPQEEDGPLPMMPIRASSIGLSRQLNGFGQKRKRMLI